MADRLINGQRRFRDDDTYVVYRGDDDYNKAGNVMAIVFLVISGLFFIMTRDVIAIILLTFSVLSMACMIIQNKFADSDKKKKDIYLSFLFFNEWRAWFGVIFVSFLMAMIGNFLFPLYIAASDKTYWDNSYWGNMYYEVYFGFFITFLLLLVAAIITLIANNLWLFHFYEGSVGENLDRTISSVVILELLCTLGFAFVLKFEGIWLSSYFPILLYITIAISIIFLIPSLYFGIIRDKHLSITTANYVLFICFICFFVFHFVMAVILYSNINVAYARTPSIFSYGFDINYLRNVIGVEKFYFSGDVEAITRCPKSLTVFNWEDSLNQFGCLNMNAFYKGRMALCLLLDLLLSLPLFEAVLIYTFDSINDCMGTDDQIKASPLYAKFQEKMRIIVSWVICILIVAGTITLLCFGPFTQSAKFVYESIDGIPLDNSKLLKQIIPNQQLNTVPNDYYYPNNINNEVVDYTLLVTIIDKSEPKKITFAYQPTDQSTTEIQKEIQTNSEVQINEFKGSSTNVPIQYTFRLIDLDSSESHRGTFTVGGLLSGKYVQLGTIVLKPDANEKGVIKGMILESNDLGTPIIDGYVIIVKGHYYPTSKEELFSNNTDFSPKEQLKNDTIFSNGVFVSFDIPVGEHTLIVYSKGYYIETLFFAIKSNKEVVDLFKIYLTKIEPKTALAVKLEWSVNVDLNLFSSFPYKDGKSCLIGYVNNECGGGKMVTSLADTKQGKFALISFDEIGPFEYSFYVHNYQRQSGNFMSEKFTKGFMPEEPDVTTENIDLVKTKAKVKLFIPEYKFAFLNDFVPPSGTGKKWDVFNMKTENNVLQFNIIDRIS